MTMEVALDSNKSLLSPVKEGISATFKGAGNLFTSMGQGLKDFGNSLPPYTPIINQSYPILWGGFCHPYHFGCFPGIYHRHFGGFYPGSVFGCHNAIYGIPTGVTHCAPIYADPMPNLRANFLPDVAPVTQVTTAPQVVTAPAQQPQPVQPSYTPPPTAQLDYTPPKPYNALGIAPIFGASFDFYNSIGVNPYEYTTPAFYNFAPNITAAPMSGQTAPVGGQSASMSVQQQIQNLTPDMFMHPEKYSKPQGTSGASTTTSSPTSSALSMPFSTPSASTPAQTQNTPEKQKNEEIASVVENNCRNIFQMRPASYFIDLKNKVAKGGKLSAHEKELYNNYVALVTKYSPFEVDEKGNIKAELDDSKTYRNIIQLSQYITSGNTEKIKNFIKKTPAIELAAVEYYWNMINKPQKDTSQPLEVMHDKSLRVMLKDATLPYGTQWSRWNTGTSKEIFNILDDKVAMISPKSMADSLYQALKDHHLLGWGLDEDRVVKLLTMMKGNKVYADAVKTEFPDSPEDLIDRTWTASRETKELAAQVFGA